MASNGSVRFRKVSFERHGARALGVVRFRKYVPQGLLQQVQAMPGRYFDPGRKQWLVPLPTIGVAARFLDWARQNRFTVCKDFAAAVEAAEARVAERMN